MGKAKIVWTNKKIQDSYHNIGYVSTHATKRTFEASNQEYPGVQHEHNEAPNKLAVVSYLSLPDPMRSIRRNKKTFLVDLVVFTHTRKKRWGMVFYGVKTKIIDYHRLYDLRKFIYQACYPHKVDYG